MHITHPDIQSYISNLTAHLCPELEELEKETYASIPMPNMLSGKEQGMFLHQFVSALNPKLVVELGTYTGYSAICMALAMSKDSKLITLDVNEEISHLPKKYFQKLHLENLIEYRLEEALPFCETLGDNSVDLAFIDADKANYPNYFHCLKNKIRPGGFILVDNILWSGQVLDEKPDNRTNAILQTTNAMFTESGWKCSILPLRDGVLIGKKGSFC
ncbi:MAG: O-methyltransferase [Chitinophagales bacterium]|nr:O-methyltransferase [Chitinophagales bacterium]